MINVLFVCTGNICRSPMAEAVFTELVREAGLSGQIRADSAGTAGYHAGEPAHEGTLAVLRDNGIHGYEGRSRMLTSGDLMKFDYVIAMDDDHLGHIRRLRVRYANDAREGMLIARLLDYAPTQPIREVPDPYYDGQFGDVYELVRAGAEGLLAAIRKEKGL